LPFARGVGLGDLVLGLLLLVVASAIVVVAGPVGPWIGVSERVAQFVVACGLAALAIVGVLVVRTLRHWRLKPGDVYPVGTDQLAYDCRLDAITNFLAMVEDKNDELSQESYWGFNEKQSHRYEFCKVWDEGVKKPLMRSIMVQNPRSGTSWSEYERDVYRIAQQVRKVIKALGWCWTPYGYRKAFERAKRESQALVELTDEARRRLIDREPPPAGSGTGKK